MILQNCIRLGERLNSVVSFVPKETKTLADIGCDHAYVPVAACLEGLCERAIACDIKNGPLKKARENIAKHGLSHRIETRAGDGLSPLKPGEADCIVIAGIGGMKAIEILDGGIEAASSAKRIIFQPQHDAPALRRRLIKNRFYISNERIVKENNKFYFIICASPSIYRPSDTVGISGLWSEDEYLTGREYGAADAETLMEFCSTEIKKCSGYMESAGRSGGDKKNEYETSELCKKIKAYERMIDKFTMRFNL